MAQFTKKTVKFVSQLNWNRSIDTIPDGQSPFALNVRANQQGEITGRPGLTAFASLNGPPTFVHSMSRLNNYSGLIAFTNVLIVGAETGLWAGKTGADLLGSTGPVPLPGSLAMSGNPLTMVDAATAGEATGWKYVGDSSQNLAVGYYPGDQVGSGGPNGGKARALTMGMLPPVFYPFPITSSAGTLNGVYQWCVAYRRIYTGARSNPSAANRVSIAVPGLNRVNQTAIFTLPTTPIDPLTGSPDANVVLDVYRFGGVVNRWAYVGTGAGGATFTDNHPDASLLSAPAPSQAIDPITGLSRFNLFKPFPVADIGRYSSAGTPGLLTLESSGVWTLTAQGTDTFNIGWLPGSTVGIGGGIYSIYQMRSSTVMELTEDLSPDYTTGATAVWAVPTGTLAAGAPMPHIWGPYGTGNAGSVIFGCGYANAAGTLYWTNGNDPDSTDIAGSLVVTSPSERLQGGCVFNGVGYVWSTERMFRIYPQGNGQFFTQEIAGGKGLWMEWSLNVQSNSISDQSITWRGKDGVYNYTEGGGTVSLTDAALYPLFPHDNQAGDGIGTAIGASGAPGRVFPALNSVAILQIPPPDDTQPKYHRITWFQGVLYYDYPGKVGGATKWRTAVYDSKQAQGWVSFDTYFVTGPSPVMRSSEIGANNLKVAVGGQIYDWTGADDAGNAIACQLTTKQDDCGDERGQKLYGDLMIDLDPGGTGASSGAGVVVVPRDGYGGTALPATAFKTAGRAQYPMELSSTGLGVLSRTFGLDLQWAASGAPVVLYQYVFAYVPKPEITGMRALDKTDDGYPGAKYLRGFVIEANTFNTARKVNVLLDGTALENPLTTTNVFTINASGQLELPFAVTPMAGYEFQLAIDTSDTSTAGWEVFQVRWVYDQWPDFDRKSSAWIPVAAGRLAYIRGVTLPIATNGAGVQFMLNSDLGAANGLAAINTGTSDKVGTPYAVSPPLLAHDVQFVPNRAVRAWYNELVWDLEVWPEPVAEWSPWLSPAGGKPCHLRGFTMPVETNGEDVLFTLLFDDGTSYAVGAAVNTPTGLKSPVGFYLPVPKVVHAIQLAPNAACRSWYSEIVWDYEPWPELEPEYSPWIAPKGERAAYLRGFVMPVDTAGATVGFQVQLASGAVVTVQSQNTVKDEKSPVVFTFLPPVVSHNVRIQPLGAARCWFDEIQWDAEEYPELAEEYTPVLDCGYSRAKFMQGCVIPIDTNGVLVTLQFITDAGLVAFTSAPISTVGKQFIALSWPPFVGHSMQIVASGDARVWWNEIVWVFEPAPELATIWQTPMMTHGLSGYLQQRLFWIAYLAQSAVVFTRALMDGTNETYLLPATGGMYRKQLLPALPSKFLAAAYSAISGQPFRVYVQDCEIHTKQWGGNDAFQPMKPIGSASVVKGADI